MFRLPRGGPYKWVVQGNLPKINGSFENVPFVVPGAIGTIALIKQFVHALYRSAIGDSATAFPTGLLLLLGQPRDSALDRSYGDVSSQ